MTTKIYHRVPADFLSHPEIYHLFTTIDSSNPALNEMAWQVFTSKSHVAPGFGKHWAHSARTQGTHCHHGCLLLACWIDGGCLGSLDYRVFMTLNNQAQQWGIAQRKGEACPLWGEWKGRKSNAESRHRRKRKHLVHAIIYTGLIWYKWMIVNKTMYHDTVTYFQIVKIFDYKMILSSLGDRPYNKTTKKVFFLYIV